MRSPSMIGRAPRSAASPPPRRDCICSVSVPRQTKRNTGETAMPQADGPSRMSDLRKIDAELFRAGAGRMPPAAFGPKPQLRWIAIDLLRVDMTYQRGILERGARNVRRIAAAFDWSMFTPVVVSESD